MTAAPSVLLVDDDDAFRERLTRALHDRGFSVTAAGDLPRAASAAESQRFDAALIDLALPGGSGIELVRRLREHQPTARLVVLTGYGSIATALEAVRAGAVDYLTKPADADRIAAALRGEVRPGPRPLTVPSLERVEWEHLQRVLHDCGSNISETARRLGLDRRSLQRKLAKLAPPR